ncbi:AbrB family transcriptional regulator [Tropicibacter naphthalenivorans]|nr:AbrB family transcriptional regulator [Tropicibacter naphthalenivorans]
MTAFAKLPDRKTQTGYAMALLLGIIGGALADWLNAPLPWFVGPMVVNTFAALMGAPVIGPNFLRPIALPALGVVLGAAFLPEIFANLRQWALPLGLIPVFILISTFVNYVFFRRIAREDAITAYLSSVPGGLTDMILLGEAYGGNTRQIALAHSMRVMVSVLAIAFVVVWHSGSVGQGAPRPVTHLGDVGLRDGAVLLACAVLGPWVAKALRIPAGLMLGALLLSAVAHLTGVTRAPVPTVVSLGAQLVLGTSVGARFAGVTFGSAARSMGFGLASSLVSLVVSAAMALVPVWLVGLDYFEALLGYAPGGMMEMSLLALAINQSVAYVTVAHIIRYVLVMLTAIGAFHVIRRWA